MQPGEIEIAVGGSNRDASDLEALEEARRSLAELRQVSPDDITDQDIVDAYRGGGFSEWPADRAGRVVRALGTKAGLHHV